MSDENSKTLGERIRELRGNGRVHTQRELAERAEVSVDLIRKLEQGQKHTARVTSLHRIARALDVTLADLLGGARFPEHDQHEGVAALRQAVTGVDDLISPVEGTPLTVREAERAEIYVWGAYWSGDHDATVAILPGIITDLRASLAAASTTEVPAVRHALARVLWAAGSTLVHMRQPDAAFISARQALTLAEQGDDEHMAATVRGALAWQLLVAGRYAEAEALSVSAASGIQPGRGATLPGLSAYGALVLQAGNSAARAGNGARARDLLAEATEVAGRVPDGRNDYSTTFGPSHVTMQGADILLCLGEFDQALAAARTMPNDGAALPVIARCRHLADRAFAHVQLGQHEPALNLVGTAASMAPNWARHQQLPRSIVRDLLHNSRERTPRLRSLAAQLQVR